MVGTLIINPHMLPKVRSEALTRACAEMPCTLRISTFIGVPCAHQSTVVGCHLPIFGKGTLTKVTDLAVVAGCSVCHDLLDWERNKLGQKIRDEFPYPFMMQLFRAQNETQARWVAMGLIQITGAKII